MTTTRPLRRFVITYIVTHEFDTRRAMSEEDFRTWLSGKLVPPIGYVIYGEKKLTRRTDHASVPFLDYPNIIYSVSCQAYWAHSLDPEPHGPWDDDNLLGSEL